MIDVVLFWNRQALRTRVLAVTLAVFMLLAIYRVAFYVPLPGVNESELARQLSESSSRW